MSPAVGVVDCGIGNVGSVLNMLARLHVAAVAVSEPGRASCCARLILPGVGAFDAAVRKLHASGFWECLNEAVLEQRKPLLGICLGMQLLGRRSEEGELPGFGWLDAEAVRFDAAAIGLPVPNMGWREVEELRPEPLLREMMVRRFYFVHSFHMVCRHRREVAAEASYGAPFAAVVRRENVAGCQFHPEKSHKYGMQLLKNFVSDAA